MLVGGDPPLAALYAVGLLLGAAETVFDSSAEAFLPALVEPDRLNHANGQLVGARWVANSFAEPIGALVGGLVAARVGLRGPMLVAGAGLALMVMVVIPIVNETQVEAARAGAGKNP